MGVHHVRTRPILQEMQTVWMTVVNQAYRLLMEFRGRSSRCTYIRVPFPVAVSLNLHRYYSSFLLQCTQLSYIRSEQPYFMQARNHKTTQHLRSLAQRRPGCLRLKLWSIETVGNAELYRDQSKPEKSADFNVPVDSVHEVGMHSLMLHSDCTEERGCLVHFLRLLAVWWPGAQSARDKVSK